MADGTYHTHADMEIALDLGTLDTTPNPITANAMDEITGETEALADGHIRKHTGRALSDAYGSNAATCKTLLVAISKKKFAYFRAQQGGVQSEGGRG